MAKIKENKKGFLVLELTRQELLDKWASCGSLGVCDLCLDKPETGYYVAVLNQWLCPLCYEKWINNATRYAEDIPIEERNFNFWCDSYNVGR